MHVGIANLRWRGKRSRHSRCMRNPQFYVSGKRPIVRYRLSIKLPYGISVGENLSWFIRHLSDGFMYRFVKSPIRHLGLAIRNVRCVWRFSPTLWYLFIKSFQDHTSYSINHAYKPWLKIGRRLSSRYHYHYYGYYHSLRPWHEYLLPVFDVFFHSQFNTTGSIYPTVSCRFDIWILWLKVTDTLCQIEHLYMNTC